MELIIQGNEEQLQGCPIIRVLSQRITRSMIAAATLAGSMRSIAAE